MGCSWNTQVNYSILDSRSESIRRFIWTIRFKHAVFILQNRPFESPIVLHFILRILLYGLVSAKK